MNNIRVIIMDVDGTLTNSEKKIPKKTKEALVKAQEAGARLILASGRPTSGLMDFARELKMEENHGHEGCLYCIIYEYNVLIAIGFNAL